MWYRVAFSNYSSIVVIDPAAPLPTKGSLLAFVVTRRERVAEDPKGHRRLRRHGFPLSGRKSGPEDRRRPL